MAAFNDAVAILHPLPGALDLEGAVDGQQLYSLLDKMSSDTVNLTVDNDKIHLRAGRVRAAFNILPVTLPIDSIDMTGTLVDLPHDFKNQLEWVSNSCARETSRPALTCVLVENGWMQASDSFRASRHRYDGNLPRLMLPVPQVDILVDSNYDIKKVALSDGGVWTRFATDEGTTLCARAMSGVYPPLTTTWAVEGREIQLLPALGEMIDRARIFSRREHAIDEEVHVRMQDRHITLSAHYEGGEFTEDIACRDAVDGVAFTIHPKFLSWALEKSGTRCVVGSDRVKFSGSEMDWEHVIALRV